MRMIQIRQALPPPSHSVAYSQLMCPCGSLLSLCLCLCLSVSVSLSGAGGDSLADGSKHSPGKGLFKAAVHAVEAVNFMLDHEIQPFSDDSQVVQVAKETAKSHKDTSVGCKQLSGKGEEVPVGSESSSLSIVWTSSSSHLLY
eukprot:COSAG03_NODE_87_length_13511_cov_37.669326_11_plen_143_part_00